ncbi:MAG: Macrolide export protein MacA [Deltaproteobacteria bacterium ADurb.BinA179]|nr:MAG: Macrolide export protein MacA [Deltaproteobacteria bacterium ADurb.BinA179]
MADRDLDKLAIDKGAKEKRVRKRFKPGYRAVAAVVAVLVLVLLAWAFLNRGVEVRVTTVSEVFPSQVLSKLSASGYVVAQRKADVATKVTGQLVSLKVQEGSVVEEGQIIAVIENDDARAVVAQNRANLNVARQQVQQTKASLEDARLTFNRMRELVKTGAVSRSEFDSARTRYEAAGAAYDAAKASVKAADAALRNAQVTLSYTEIKAPFDAVVLTKNADVGDIITFEGTVASIVPTVDRTKATVLVKVSFKELDPRILPEMSAKVGFLARPLLPGEMKPRVMVSSKAVVREDEGEALFLVKGSRAEKVRVSTDGRFGDMVVVTRGAKPGDTVVADPPEDLRDGSKLTILEK